MLEIPQTPLVGQLANLFREKSKTPSKIGRVIDWLAKAFQADAGFLFWVTRSSLYQLQADLVDQVSEENLPSMVTDSIKLDKNQGFDVRPGHSCFLDFQGKNWLMIRLRIPFDHLFLGFCKSEGSWAEEETKVVEWGALVLMGLLEEHPYWSLVGEIHMLALSSSRDQQLLRMLAHDFGNYVTTVLGFSELSLLQVKGDGPIRRYLEQVNKTSKQTSKWISRLRLIPPRHDGRAITMNSGAILAEEVKQLAAAWGSQVKLQLRLEPNQTPITIEEGDFRVLVRELINNGAENSRGKKGTIQIASKIHSLTAGRCLVTLGSPEPGQFLHLTIKDNGRGFPDEIQSQVIRNLYQPGRPRLRGIGLAVVLGILQSHGGGLNILPNQPTGTIVEIFLPTHTPNEVPCPKSTEH